MSRETEPTKMLREAWVVLKRHHWRFIIPAFLAMALVLITSLVLPRQYKAEALFDRRTDMVLTELASQGAARPIQDDRQSLAKELSGQPVIDAAVDKMLERIEAGELQVTTRPTRGALRSELRRKLTIHWDISTNELSRVRASVVMQDPKLARASVNTLVETYIAQTRETLDRRLEDSGAFFRQEVARERQEIEAIEAEMLAFEIEHAELLPEHPGNLQSLVAGVETELAELAQRKEAVALKEKRLRESLEQTAETTRSLVTSRNPELEQLQRKLREMNTTMTTYLGTYKMTEQHPDLIALREQISALEAQIKQTPEEIVIEKHMMANPKHREVDLMLTAATAESEAIESRTQALERRLEQLNAESERLYPMRSEYRKLKRSVEEHQRQLAFWEENLRRIDMAMTAENGNRGMQLDFIRPCGVLEKPISPDLFQVIAAALVLGLLSGAAGVYFAHRTDESFHDANKLATGVNLQLLGSVSELISVRERRLRRLHGGVLVPLHTLALASVLMALGALLYLDLEQPQLFDQLRESPKRFFQSNVLGGD